MGTQRKVSHLTVNGIVTAMNSHKVAQAMQDHSGGFRFYGAKVPKSSYTSESMYPCLFHILPCRRILLEFTST